MNSSDKVNILMVDDQPAKLLSYEVILKELGENLIAASSGIVEHTATGSPSCRARVSRAHVERRTVPSRAS